MKTITIRNVPEETHAELAARAARAGQSLQEYLKARLVEVAEKPDMQTLMERIRERKRTMASSLSVEQILADKDADRL